MSDEPLRLYNPWQNIFEDRDVNARACQKILDYAESRFRQILMVLHNSTEPEPRKLWHYLMLEVVSASCKSIYTHILTWEEAIRDGANWFWLVSWI